MGWFRKNWRTVAGAACGLGSVAVGIFASPVAGLVAGGVCTTIFGVSATRARALGEALYEELSPSEQRYLQGKLGKVKPPPVPR